MKNLDLSSQRHECRMQNAENSVPLCLCASVPSRAAGFTLIEMVIVIVLLALTAGITTHYLVSASRLYALLLAKKQADSEVVDAVNRMRREARLHVQTITANSNEWKFYNTYDVTNQFVWSGTEVTLNSNRLATGIGRFALSYYNATNGQLPFPVTNNYDSISRVALDIKAINNMADSELKANFFMRNDLLK